MKLDTFIKQSLLCFLTIFMVGGCGYYLLGKHLGVEFPTNLSGMEEAFVVLLYYCALWGAYCAICERYAVLEDMPIFFLSILFISSGLLALVVPWGEIKGCISLITPLFKRKSIFSAILVLQLILFEVVFIVMPWFIAVRSGQALYNKQFKRP